MATPWQSCRLHLVGQSTPVVVTGRAIARAELLRAWGEGDRRRVVRVVDERGEDLAPADVDWTGFPGGEPTRRAGRPATGRSTQVLVRLSDVEHEAISEAAARAGMSVAAWMRTVSLAAATK